MDHESLQREDVVEMSSNRTFGFVFVAVFLIVALLPLISGGRIRVWSLAVAGAILAVSLVAPDVLAPLNRLWMRFGMVLHRIVSPLVLGILFFVIVTPMGVLMRLFGKDPLRLKREPGSATYWVARTPPGPARDSFDHQF